MASFEREAASDYRLSPAQGDPWDEVSATFPAAGDRSRHGPTPRSMPIDWTASTEFEAANWTWPRACYYGELFNGFGYRSHGVNTPYLWSWSNNYRQGKYIADGKWSPSTVDQQCGMIPLMVALQKLDPTLALSDPCIRNPIARSSRHDLSIL